VARTDPSQLAGGTERGRTLNPARTTQALDRANAVSEGSAQRVPAGSASGGFPGAHGRDAPTSTAQTETSKRAAVYVGVVWMFSDFRISWVNPIEQRKYQTIQSRIGPTTPACQPASPTSGATIVHSASGMWPSRTIQ